MKEEYQSCTSENRQLKHQLKSKQAQIDELIDEVTHLDKFQNQVRQLKKQVAYKDQQIEELQQNSDHLERDLDFKTRELKQLVLRVESMETNMDLSREREDVCREKPPSTFNYFSVPATHSVLSQPV